MFTAPLRTSSAIGSGGGAHTAAAKTTNLREIFGLYKELYAQMTASSTAATTPNEAGHGAAWQQLVACITAASANVGHHHTSYDNATLQARCCAHISSSRGARPADVAEFRRLNETLAAQMSQRQHGAVLQLLLQLADAGNGTTSGTIPRTASTSGSSGLRTTFERSLSMGTTSSSSTGRNAASEAALNGDGLQKLAAPAATASSAPTTTAVNASDPQLSRMEPLVQDVIYALGGVDGRYLRRDIISLGYKLDPKTAGQVAASHAGAMLRIAELGYYHNWLVEFLRPTSGRTPFGLMGQGLCTMMEADLTNYYGFVAMLQEEFNRNREDGGGGWKDANGADDDTAPRQPLTLLKLMMLCGQPLHRFGWIATIAESCQTLKGGELASAIGAYRTNGDPDVEQLVDEMLVAVCGPLQQMLARWLLDGEINDPFGEFFIEALPDVGADRLWSDKYRVRRGQLPAFVSGELANKVLVTGKSVNFLREVCLDRTPVRGREELLQCLLANAGDVDDATAGADANAADGNAAGMLFAVVPDTRLHALIERVYLNTSARVKDIVMGPHKLLQHLQAMRNYLLLGQGDFVGHLIEHLKPELDRPAKELHQYELATILDTAIRATNAQYDDPEVIGQLEVRLLRDYEDDLGWDTFTLRYSVQGPLATMLEQSMPKYQQLFKPLWRMKHLELVLSAKVWREQIHGEKMLRPLMRRELAATSKRLHLVTHQMVHFIHQMLYYILFEVIECQWTEMLAGVRRARTLDDIFAAHDRFLRQVRRDAFLENDDEIYLRMSSVFNAIAKLEGWQDEYYGLCFEELGERKKLAEEVKRSKKKGEFGVTAERMAVREAECKAFGFSLQQMHADLDKIGVDYEMCVRKFLLLLARSADTNIQLFGTRLDFNEYYKKRDGQLDVPLTFAQLRQSALYTSKNSMSWSAVM